MVNAYCEEIREGSDYFFATKKLLLNRLDIELTERCNNNCLHCYVNLPLDDIWAQKKELSTAQVKKILKEAASLGCLTARFTGGEPLVRLDFEDLYIFARMLGLKVQIFTNATLITPQLAKLFKKIPPLKKIEVSTYGMKEDSYTEVSRVKGNFELAWQGIRRLSEHKIPFVIKSSLLPANKHELKAFESLAMKIPWMEGLPPTISMHLYLRSKRNDAKNKMIKRIRIKPEEAIKIMRSRGAYWQKALREFCAKFTAPRGDRLFSCGAGIGSGCVNAYGFLQPCTMLRYPKTAYNLKEGSLQDALVRFFPQIRKMKARNPRYLLRCGRCFLKGLCKQCPATSWLEHGTLDTPTNYFCGLAHAQARMIGLLHDGEVAWRANNWQSRIKLSRSTGQGGSNESEGAA
ncbi:MAG: radical SAM protein [Candidatus Omnitrophota bacterium]